ncbi:MAG: hypothetical protein CMH48_12470 [Muricauda sp.]|nr:hypothetical protein [Allomuricauda sp.]MAU27089.1 hypothetical protein [Allomuricauda sp.]MBC31642.1 hypothetical protein [Allomuricauda sp.]|tara:strand:+ start:2761 stop:3195 length:435 start_codon:yes stop_codon:yes gene_type:complete
MTSTVVKPPAWFWVVGIIALLWNLVGVFNYLNLAFNKTAVVEALTEEQGELFTSIPAWATAAFAIAVFSGALASIALLLRKKWAKPLFVLSLVAAVLQFINWLFLQNAAEAFGPQAYVTPALVVAIGAFLIFFAQKGIQKGWLR